MKRLRHYFDIDETSTIGNALLVYIDQLKVAASELDRGPNTEITRTLRNRVYAKLATAEKLHAECLP